LSFEIEQRFRSLEQLVIAAAAQDLDELSASYLCKLGSVLICGNLERCVELALTDIRQMPAKFEAKIAPLNGLGNGK
jgi:hypothetical protein